MNKNTFLVSEKNLFPLEGNSPIVLILTLFSNESEMLEQLGKIPDKETQFIVFDVSRINLKAETYSRYIIKLIDRALEQGTILLYLQTEHLSKIPYKTNQFKHLFDEIIFKVTPDRFSIVFGTNNTDDQGLVRNILSKIRHLPTFSIIEGLQPSIEKTCRIVKESLKTA
jgi:hypothetical protein